MHVIRENDSYRLEVKRHQSENEVRLLCRSTGRQGKDQGIRGRQERLFLERLQYYHDGLSKKGHTKSYPKVLEMIGRLREKYPRASKLYDIDVQPRSHTGEKAQGESAALEKAASVRKPVQIRGLLCTENRSHRADRPADLGNLSNAQPGGTAFVASNPRWGSDPIFTKSKPAPMRIYSYRCSPITYCTRSNTNCASVGITARGLSSVKSYQPSAPDDRIQCQRAESNPAASPTAMQPAGAGTPPDLPTPEPEGARAAAKNCGRKMSSDDNHR